MRVFLSLFLVAASASSAFGQWRFHKQESAFGAAPEVFVGVSAAGQSFAFRCDEDGVKTIFQTRAPLGQKEAALRITYGSLLLRPDSGTVRRGDAVPDVFDGKLQVLAQMGTEILKEIGSAKDRLSVAVDMGGEIRHETVFPIKGAKEVLDQFIQACPVASQY